MALVDLNIADDDDSTTVADGDRYCQAPHIYLTAAQVKALGITEPPRAGTRLSLRAVVCVESSTESLDGDEDDPDIRLTLCMEYAELGSAEAPKDASTELYGNG